jgi:hypothetical protein
MNKKIATMLLISTLLCVAGAKAQFYVGVEAGANRNYFISNTADKPFFDYQPLYGFSAGASVRYAFPNVSWFGGVQASPSFVQKNYRIQRTGYYSDLYQDNTDSYVQLPVMAQFRFGGNISKTQSLHGILNLGAFGDYWMKGTVKGRTLSPMDQGDFTSFNEAYSFSAEKDRRFQFGGLAGVGLQYMPNKKYAISLEGRYTPTFSDAQNAYMENQTPRYNDCYSLLLNVQYQLPVSKHKSTSK